MENFLKLLWVILVFIIFFLFGCSSKIVDNETSDKDTIILMKANEIQQTNIKTFKTFDMADDSGRYTCINTSDVDILVNDYLQLKTYIKQQKDIIDYYEEQIEKVNKHWSMLCIYIIMVIMIIKILVLIYE